MSNYTYEKLYLLKKNVFLNFLSDHKSIDAAKQLRYAGHYYTNIRTKNYVKRVREPFKWLQHKKNQKKTYTYNDLIIAYASRYKARLNYLYMIYR